MQMQLAVFDPITNVLLADWSIRIKSCNVKTGAHGYESCEAELNLPFNEAFLYYQQLGPLKLRVSWGSYRVWEGRLEDPTQFADTSSGLKITAFGGWVAFNDAPIVALWSDTKYDSWQPITNDLIAGFNDQMYIMDTQSRLFIGHKKGNTYGNATDVGAYHIQIPDDSSRGIVGISFDYTQLIPTNWEFRYERRNADYSNIASTILVTGNGATQSGSINITFGAAAIVSLLIFNNTGGVSTPPGENGANFLKITNLRVVTSTNNQINTTLGTNIAAGTRTVTPAAMAHIYVGQRLFIDQGSATVAESVIVTAITANTFTAVFAFAHVIASTVNAHVVYPDEIIKDCVSILNALNPTQLSSDVTKIQSQAIDIDQAIYEDAYPAEIINQLIAKSDNQTPPRQWVSMVYDEQTLIVRPRGTGNAWYTDITILEVVRTLTQLYNSIYVVYSDVNNKRALRTAITTDADSVDKFKITRRKPIKVDTSDSVQATKIRDSVLALQTDPVPRANIELNRVFDKYDNPFPLFMVKADDTLTLRNLPPVLGTVYDKIRTLVIVRTNVDLIKNTLQLDLETATPNIAVQLAQALGSKT